MNLKNIIKGLEQTEADVCYQLSDRRDALRNFGSKMAVAALPGAVSSFFKKDSYKAPTTAVESLNLALEVKHFEHSFYKAANNATGLIPAQYAAGFKEIEAHKEAQIAFFTKAVGDMGGTPFTLATAHDHTHGSRSQVLSCFETFLMTAQSIENAGLQAQSKLMESLVGSPLFAKVQQVATADARHGAHAKMIRREMHVEDVPAKYLVGNFAHTNVQPKSNLKGKSKHAQLGMA